MRQTIYTLLLFFGYHYAIAQQVNYGDNSAAGQYYSVNGIRIYAEIYGSGEPLLLLHGNGGNISAFKQNIPYLAQKFKVIAMDSRAQGKSADPSETISFEQMAGDCKALLDVLKINSAHVLGWSDGGIIALIMAKNYPDKVRSIAVTGANIFVDETAFAEGLYNQWQQAYTDNKNSAFTDPVKKNDWKLFLLDMFQPTMKFDDLRAIRCPALVIAGDRDLIAIGHTVGIFQHIPNAQLWIVPNCGHGTLVDKAEDFNKTVGDFFGQKK